MAPTWKEALPAPPVGGRLIEAWMTSFEPPDASLLVEHVLPVLLNVNSSLTQEVKERKLFFAELATALERLHGRLTVISSPSVGAREGSQYPWLWRYVSHYMVGAGGAAVQHAKLWAFHWQTSEGEAIELHVSSTNLSSSAFKHQLQAGWHVTLPLGDKPTEGTRRTWGELVPFLEALGASVGSDGRKRIQRLVALLGRVRSPADVAFVASVPGGKSAARQLAKFEPSAIHMLTPTVGEWNDRSLKAWTADIGVTPTKVHLKWIAETHPWAKTAGWALSKVACGELQRSGVWLDCLSKGERFVPEHHESDSRWSHAKLYLLRSRRKRRLLLTSANWSVSAWGAGKASPRNFELGVVFDSEWTALETLGEPFAPPDTVPYCIERTDEDVRLPLEWADATWDGKHIALRARSADSVAPIHVAVTFMKTSALQVQLAKGEAAVPWTDPERTPLVARFTQGAWVLDVDVADLRSAQELEETPLPEVAPEDEEALREAFLLQRYGGPAVDVDSIAWADRGGAPTPVGAAAPAGDYTVQAWLDARAAFNLLDRWRAALEEAGNDLLRREVLLKDGERIRAIYARRSGPGAALVVEELDWRLGEES